MKIPHEDKEKEKRAVERKRAMCVCVCRGGGLPVGREVKDTEAEQLFIKTLLSLSLFSPSPELKTLVLPSMAV